MLTSFFHPVHTAASELTQDEQAKYQQQYEKQKLINYLYDRAYAKRGTWQGQCVVAVRTFLAIGRDQIQGYAGNFKITTRQASVGAIVKFPHHVGVVIDFNDTDLIYYDSNGSWTERAAIRTIKINSKRILGYKPVALGN